MISSSVQWFDGNIVQKAMMQTLKDCLNQYFNLQYNAECLIDLGMKDSNGGDVVLPGRTIMNTFDLYVVMSLIAHLVAVIQFGLVVILREFKDMEMAYSINQHNLT